MSLWTPYNDAPLDLSKKKEERRTPPEETHSPPVDYYRPYTMPPPIAQPVPYYPNYAYYRSVSSISPVSGSSSSSGCVVAPPVYGPVPPVVLRYNASLPRECDTNRITTTQPSPDSVMSTWSPVSKSTTSPTPECSAESLSDDVEYQEFEKNALRAMAVQNGGTLLKNNPRMRRAVQSSQVVDDCYKEQRQRNNFAAKQSRDRRKLREVRLAVQVTFLQKKLAALRAGEMAGATCVRCKATERPPNS